VANCASIVTELAHVDDRSDRHFASSRNNFDAILAPAAVARIAFAIGSRRWILQIHETDPSLLGHATFSRSLE
jgi:hypothetical protein